MTTRGGVDRGRGRGRGLGRGAPTREDSTLTASGPFALGPSALSTPSTSRRQNQFIPTTSGRLGGLDALKSGSSLTKTGAAPLLQRNRDDAAGLLEDDVEVYSEGEGEDGGEIVDLWDVKRLDVMAPDALKREKKKEKRKKSIVLVKKEEQEQGKGKGPAGEW